MKKSICFKVMMLASIIAVVLMVPAVFAPPSLPEVGDYQVTFVGVVYDEAANTSTWTYDVTCFGDPEISHFDFEFKFCDPPLTSVLDAGPDPWEIVDPDPTTGVSGIKYDIQINNGDTLTVWFTLEGLWGVNDIEVWIKAGHQDPYAGPSYLPDGPACFFIPEVPLGTLGALAAAFVGLVFIARKRSKN